MNSAELSLVICTRDRPADAQRAVATALRHLPPKIDLVVIDQGGDSATHAALSVLPGAARLIYRRHPALGLGAARNLGMLEARGSIVAFTDDDCEVEPGFGAGLARAFLAEEGIGMVFGSVAAGPHDPTRGFIPAYLLKRAELARGLGDKHRVEGIGACMAVRRDTWRRLGGFDEMLGAGARFKAAEDTDFAIRCLALGACVYETPLIGVIHHGFRTWQEGEVLIPGYLYGIGALFGKHLRCGRLGVLQVAARLAWRWAFSGPVVEFGHRPQRWPRLVAFGRGFWEALRTPADRRLTLFRADGANLRSREFAELSAS